MALYEGFFENVDAARLAQLTDHAAGLGILAADNADASEGLTGGFPYLSIRGKAFRLKMPGQEERTLKQANGKDNLTELPCIVLAVSPAVSKTYYHGKYAPGSDAEPDCWSNDGFAPDASIQHPINTLCKSCPNNVFGSSGQDIGKKLKACSDNRRIAVYLPAEVVGEEDAGPAMMRLAINSMQDLDKYAKELRTYNLSLSGVMTALTFDQDTDFPKVQFNGQRPLIIDAEIDELQLVADLRADTALANMLIGREQYEQLKQTYLTGGVGPAGQLTGPTAAASPETPAVRMAQAAGKAAIHAQGLAKAPVKAPAAPAAQEKVVVPLRPVAQGRPGGVAANPAGTQVNGKFVGNQFTPKVVPPVTPPPAVAEEEALPEDTMSQAGEVLAADDDGDPDALFPVGDGTYRDRDGALYDDQGLPLAVEPAPAPEPVKAPIRARAGVKAQAGVGTGTVASATPARQTANGATEQGVASPDINDLTSTILNRRR